MHYYCHRLAFVVLASLLVSSPVAAQTAETRTAIVMINAPIYLRPDVTRTPLRVAAVNTSLKVLEDNAEWLQVEFHDPQYGPRVGFIESKNVRINKPDLRPMDLSVRQTTAPEIARVPATRVSGSPEQVPAASDVVGGHRQTREGFWFNAGLGIGSSGCEDCIARDSGLSGGLSLGGTLNDRVLIGVGTTGFSKSVEGGTYTVGTLDARVRFYPSHTNGFFLNGGVGLGSLSYAGESELGLEIMLGVGWDIRVGEKVSLTPFWNGFAMSNANVDANVGQLGIGVTIH
jgi:hypothetical protein